MNRIVYLNGQWCLEENAQISIFDRSILFADSVYEVTCFLDQKLLDFDAHMERLKSSLNKLNIEFQVNRDELLALHRDIISRNSLNNGVVYLQVTRGAVDRDFHYDNTIKPHFFMFTQTSVEKNLAKTPQLKMISLNEGRWSRRDIKTTQLLYSSLAKTRAHEEGADDAIYIENGMITEATSSNFHIIDRNNTFITRPLDGTILPGITRATLLNLAKQYHIRVEERLFTLDEVYHAKEALISSATSFATPVVSVDGKLINDGLAGQLTLKLRQLYLDNVTRL